MSLDGAFLHLVKQELIDKGLIGSRVDKIHQPSKDEVVVTLRFHGGSERVLFSADPQCARICSTSAGENPQSPPMFCMLMRKYLSGGRLLSIEQDGLERIISFEFECTNEIGDLVRNRLVAEIMGRFSNIILLTQKDGEWRVVDSVKRVGDGTSSVRRILPGVAYELPPRATRLDVRVCTQEEALSVLEANAENRFEKAAQAEFEGLSPVILREWAYYSGRDTSALCKELDKDRFLFFFKNLRSALEGKAKFCVIAEKNGQNKDFTFINIEQYGTSMLIKQKESACEVLDGFFREKSDSQRLKQRSGDLLKLILNLYQRTAKKLELQRAELSDCKNREQFRVRGDLLSANLYRMEKGMNEITVENYYTGENETIKLDVRLSPSQNAQKLYAEYKKLDTAEKMLTKLIAQGEQELIYLDSVFDAAARATFDAELQEIRQELCDSGYIRKGKNEKTEKSRKALPPLKFVSSDGYEILVGRNNIQNDKLTLKTAGATDLWFHTHDIPGAHVILFTKGQTLDELPDRAVLEAACLAATSSKASSGTKIPVDYAYAKFVKKPNGAKPGMVIFTNNFTLLSDPDKELMERLRAQ